MVQSLSRKFIHPTDNTTPSQAVINKFIFNAPFSISVFDTGGHLIKSNVAFNKNFGHLLDQTKRIEVFLAHFNKAPLNDLSNLQTGRLGKIEVHYSETEDKTFQLSVFTVEQEGQNMIVLMANDITSHEEAHNRSRHREQLLKIVNENVMEGIYQYVEDDGFLYTNKSFHNLFGFSSNDIKNLTFCELLEDGSDLFNITEKLKYGESIKNKVITFRRKDNTVFVGLLNVSARKFKNKISHHGTILDVTKDATQKELLETKEKEVQNVQEIVDRLLYSTSHDFKSPICTIEGLVQLMRFEWSDDVEVQSYVNKLTLCVEKLKSTICSIGDYSLVSRKRISFERINFEQLINRVILDLSNLSFFVDTKIELDIVVDYPFYSDYKAIEMILKNIVENSIKYRDEAKEKSTIDIKVNQSIEWVYIEITDNGIGIPKVYLNKVFGLFYRASIKSQGSGLGLYIAKESIGRLKGDITIESEVGQGTLVILKIPNGPKGKLMTEKMMLKNGKLNG